MDEKQRVIQEYVPGKQITLAHLIAHPGKDIYTKLGFQQVGNGAIGIMTITPGEAAIIAADVALKSGDVTIGFLDRFSGTVVIYGDVSSIESSLENVNSMLSDVLKFTPTKITRS